jgi:NOL1/NOP2/fmu family ribosome biogenesis protein
VLNLYRKGLRQVLVQPPPEEGLLLAGNDELYVTPMDPALWTGLHVLRPGWRVAYLRHGEVEADHALAVALRPQEAQRSVNLEVDDPRVTQYLRGSPWPDDGPAGRVLVTVEGFPLGWARRGGGRLTSRYPIHLRQKGSL